MGSIGNIGNFQNYWAIAASFGLNGNILDTNLINLIVVLGVLTHFGKGVSINLLDNRERTIPETIRDAEERYEEAIDKLEKAKIRLQEARLKASDIRANGLLQMERERQDLADAADEDSKTFENDKNSTIRFEKRRAIEQVRQQISRLASDRSLGSLNSLSGNELHLRMIDYHIGLPGGMGDVTN
uniref:ATP synthase CF0 subunit I n=1 Tax=Schizaea poeppigiana TaxID=148578 RepID=UPI002115BD60|nr:ATP synthase CF0 subunit I [Schizaea poeppigiana]UTJ90378.1 ATP synthase CF0 subunit I [Schizaea poeppigiana]